MKNEGHKLHEIANVFKITSLRGTVTGVISRYKFLDDFENLPQTGGPCLL